MSGQQIGAGIGLVVGAYFGMPQLGMAIGGMIGGAIDPTQINGPKIGDGQTQTATDGSPIAWVMGTATIAGTIVQVGPRRQVKIEDSGKGSGTQVNHYEARQDFAILVCESSETRNSTMSSVLMVQQDGKIVYDMRTKPSPPVGSDNSAAVKALVASKKWKEGIQFHYGAEDQLPDPTLEALTGVGNTPSYRGDLLMVASNFNVTAAGDRIPSFSFTVSAASTATVEDNVLEDYDTVSTGQVCEKDQDNVHGWKQTVVLPNPVIGIYKITGIPLWAITKTTVATSPLTVGAGLVCIHPDAAEGWLYEVGEYDTGWTDYYGTMAQAATWFSDHGLPLPQAIPLPAFPIDCAGPDYVINSYSVTQLRYAGGFDDGPNEVSFKFALTGGRDLRPIGGGYYADMATGKIWRPSWVAPFTGGTTYTANTVMLDDLVSRICIRGGLTVDDIDVTDLAGIEVYGYPLARQMNAVDALTPLLQAFFAYASEYDGQIHFHLYGADATLTIDEDDLLEASDANDNNVTSNMRNQATEFPRKINGSYIDPAQNYTPVTVTAERIAVDVTAIGEQTMSIPVVMPADQAKQAVEKALKIAYATLEGTQEYSVPLARNATYLSLCAGDVVLFRGKRWVIDEAVLGNGYMKLSTRYDRQSAYTSNVQAVVGNAPSTPTSPYSGPTKLIAMNLPSLRPQDTYGLYLAANSAGIGNWRGCTVQVSYDGQITWQNATVITEGSTFGTVVANEPTGGEPLTVLVNGDLATITSAQLAANGNGFAIKHGSSDEVGQFLTATEDATIVDQYGLTGTLRGLGGTAYIPAVSGETFTMLDAVYFLPISLDFTGKTIYLRGVGFGESAEDAQIISIVYTATQIVPTVTFNRVDSSGNLRVDSDGNQRVTI